ncbi:PREDICTED: neuropilin and tolloid-like protein 2 [Priapulus caudatus]|uniref:Neuropilin and tolloid-like protein 2 n=1 Tax=Priapulus caudatus TaxID=37621 RepID=A0ABM1EA02_PRICU|nr:PREDICTED: neuropilin and tolloid-like protein 2 [Priapulus caudatus]
MWVVFHSDDVIEYQGFHAVYDFIEDEDAENVNPMDDCLTVISGKMEGFINSSMIGAKFLDHAKKNSSLPLDCAWDIRVQSGYNIYFQLESLKLVAENECDVNFLEMYDGSTHVGNVQRFCHSTRTPYKTQTNRLVVRAFGRIAIATQTSEWPRFQAMFNMFRSGKCVGSDGILDMEEEGSTDTKRDGVDRDVMPVFKAELPASHRAPH